MVAPIVPAMRKPVRTLHASTLKQLPAAHLEHVKGGGKSGEAGGGSVKGEVVVKQP